MLLDSEQLRRAQLSCRDQLRCAAVVALDAEWEPSAKQPAATLVQLALRGSAGGQQAVLLVRCRRLLDVQCTRHIYRLLWGAEGKVGTLLLQGFIVATITSNVCRSFVSIMMALCSKNSIGECASPQRVPLLSANHPPPTNCTSRLSKLSGTSGSHKGEGGGGGGGACPSQPKLACWGEELSSRDHFRSC